MSEELTRPFDRSTSEPTARERSKQLQEEAEAKKQVFESAKRNFWGVEPATSTNWEDYKPKVDSRDKGQVGIELEAMLKAGVSYYSAESSAVGSPVKVDFEDSLHPPSSEADTVHGKLAMAEKYERALQTVSGKYARTDALVDIVHDQFIETMEDSGRRYTTALKDAAFKNFKWLLGNVTLGRITSRIFKANAEASYNHDAGVIHARRAAESLQAEGLRNQVLDYYANEWASETGREPLSKKTDQPNPRFDSRPSAIPL